LVINVVRLWHLIAIQDCLNHSAFWPSWVWNSPCRGIQVCFNSVTSYLLGNEYSSMLHRPICQYKRAAMCWLVVWVVWRFDSDLSRFFAATNFLTYRWWRSHTGQFHTTTCRLVMQIRARDTSVLFTKNRRYKKDDNWARLYRQGKIVYDHFYKLKSKCKIISKLWF